MYHVFDFQFRVFYNYCLIVEINCKFIMLGNYQRKSRLKLNNFFMFVKLFFKTCFVLITHWNLNIESWLLCWISWEGNWCGRRSVSSRYVCSLFTSFENYHHEILKWYIFAYIFLCKMNNVVLL